jgi:hypothetical protein
MLISLILESMCNCKTTFFKNLIEYNVVTQEYSLPQQVVLDRYCNGLVIKNAGNTLVIIMGDTLQPGESKSIGGNYGEVYRARTDINFLPPPVPPLVTQNLAVVTQKFYLETLSDF